MIWVLPDGCNPPTGQEIQEAQVQSLGQEDPLEKEMATHSSILAWKIPQRVDWQALMHGVTVRHDWGYERKVYIYILISGILILALILWFMDWWQGDHQACHSRRREAGSSFWGGAERQVRSCLLGARSLHTLSECRSFSLSELYSSWWLTVHVNLAGLKYAQITGKHHFGVCLLRMSLDKISFWINRLSKEDCSHQWGGPQLICQGPE